MSGHDSENWFVLIGRYVLVVAWVGFKIPMRAASTIIFIVGSSALCLTIIVVAGRLTGTMASSDYVTYMAFFRHQLIPWWYFYLLSVAVLRLRRWL